MLRAVDFFVEIFRMGHPKQSKYKVKGSVVMKRVRPQLRPLFVWLIGAMILLGMIWLTPIYANDFDDIYLNDEDLMDFSPSSDVNEIASGTVGSGGASWQLYDDGTVIVGGGMAHSAPTPWNGLPGVSPWLDHADDVFRIVFTEPISGGPSLSGFFWQLSNLSEIVNLSYLDTSQVRYMDHLFAETNLTTIDVSGFDTRHVVDMAYMFGYSRLTQIDVSSFDTSNVTHMGGMFADMPNLIAVDVSGFNTSSVINMNSMFAYSPSLTHINFGEFDTNRVENIASMFAHSSSLTHLDLSSFDFSNVRQMGAMFEDLPELRQLTLGEGWERHSNFLVTQWPGHNSPELTNPPNNETYTGFWQNVGNGTVTHPQGSYALTATELMNSEASVRPPTVDTWVWQRRPQALELTFDFNFEGAPANQQREVQNIGFYGDAINEEGNLLNPAFNVTNMREGYYFRGWFTAPTGGLEVTYTIPVRENVNHTLYARWENQADVTDPYETEPDETNLYETGPNQTYPTETYPNGTTLPLLTDPEEETTSGASRYLPQAGAIAASVLLGGVALVAIGSAISVRKRRK